MASKRIRRATARRTDGTKPSRRLTGLLLVLLAAAAVVAWTLSAPGEAPRTLPSAIGSRPAAEPPAPSARSVEIQAPAASHERGPRRGPVATLPSTDLPPLPMVQFPAPRPPEVIRAVYSFAAHHPEVLDYVPCFCGCENFGHADNHDCFVAGRGPDGRVTWDAHGMG